ncbi:MAG: hypothetical protein KME11_17415 [Timaviella obliquedivisa GSE-PSE-MK23-08B]|jgi:hypothetical protein|nr:hypothetical protein [Timaviella obliquedivisa GSE-PSE-MK23-08B]
MKIQLEHRQSSCPQKLRCIACRQIFAVGRVRSLLVNDEDRIQGDLCSKCVRLTADEIRLILTEQVWLMLEQPQLFQHQVESPETLALELFEVALEDLEIPSSYQRLMKTLESYLFFNRDNDRSIGAIADSTQSPWHHNY